MNGLRASWALPWLLAACVSAPRIVPREEVEPRSALYVGGWDYLIGPGDVLRVNVFGRPELSSPVLENSQPGSPVDGTGAVMLPLVGAVDVGGATVREAGERIEQALSHYLKDPHVDVAVVDYRSKRFLVLGEVDKPGVYAISRPITAMEALALAGGVSSFSNRKEVAWVRGSLTEANLVLLDAGDIDPLTSELVSAGDVIFVGRRGWADVSEAARDLIPVLQTVSIPLSIAIQAATLQKIN